MIAAVRAPGGDYRKRAKEPHMVANFRSMGADIRGAGGCYKSARSAKLRGGTYSVFRQGEAGTFLAAVATGRDILISNIIPKHLECITTKFTEMGVEIERETSISEQAAGEPHEHNLPYPGFQRICSPDRQRALLCERDKRGS